MTPWAAGRGDNHARAEAVVVESGLVERDSLPSQSTTFGADEPLVRPLSQHAPPASSSTIPSVDHIPALPRSIASRRFPFHCPRAKGGLTEDSGDDEGGRLERIEERHRDCCAPARRSYTCGRKGESSRGEERRQEVERREEEKRVKKGRDGRSRRGKGREE